MKNTAAQNTDTDSKRTSFIGKWRIPWLPTDSAADSRRKETKRSRDAFQQTQKSYKVRIISKNRQTRNENYWEYNIEVLDDPKFAKRKCILTERKGKVRKLEEQIEAKSYKGTIFNVKQ